MINLWERNTPQEFWMCKAAIPEEAWRSATLSAASALGFSDDLDIQRILAMSLGEARFGEHHWELSGLSRLYYSLKPFLPRFLTRLMRRFYKSNLDGELRLHWPIDRRYAVFQWEVLHQVMLLAGRQTLDCRPIWPSPFRFAFVLTHDVETARGQAFVRQVADLEQNLGFRSSFNFVMERYPLNLRLMHELRERGFEVGCHGLKHDGKLFSSHAEFTRRAGRINKYMREYGMVGFRAPLTHRNPEWMQALEAAYDLSFFDTDPHEPIPGGVMTIWPYFMGHMVELPYTLVQDYTLTSVLRQRGPAIWLQKIDFIEKYFGLALLNSHPDYLQGKATWEVYGDFLSQMKARPGYWHVLPRDAAQWWKDRVSLDDKGSNPARRHATYALNDSRTPLGDST